MGFDNNTPLVAILRGVLPQEAVSIAQEIADAGFTMIEVPLNSPDALKSVQKISDRFGEELLIGAGTVLTDAEVESVAEAGGRLVVSPNMDPRVITRTKSLNLVSGPGVSTPSEAFAALDAGADFLKVFPAEMIEPETLRSWRSVLNETVLLVPVGGMSAENLGAYMDAGATGVGVGGSVYCAGDSVDSVRTKAEEVVKAMQDWRSLSCRRQS